MKPLITINLMFILVFANMHHLFGQFLSGYDFRKLITIQGGSVSGSHTDFPVLVLINADADLATHAQANGFDILFTDSDGTTVLPHQMVSYNNGNLEAWVKMNLTANANKAFYMYYGATTPVGIDPSTNTTWDTNFQAVYHFQTNFLDATANVRNGTNSGSDDVAGKIGQARNFTDGNDRVELGTWSVAGSAITLSAWVRHSVINNGDPRIISKADGANEQDHVWYIGHRGVGGGRGLGARLKTGTDNNSGTTTHIGTSQWAANTWYHTVMTYDGANIRLYVNGVLETTTVRTGNLRQNNWNIWIGNGSGSTRNFNGIIDEPRISNVARSTGWIQTEYNNQNNPSTFYTISAQQLACDVAGIATAFNGYLVSGQSTSITLSGFASTASSIQWQQSTDGSNFTNISGATTITYTTPTLTATTFYRALVTDGCTSASTIAKVSIGPSFLTGYCYRKTISIDPSKVVADLVNFPLLVKLEDPQLRTIANNGFVAFANGDDIRFTDVAGNELNREIEQYDPVAGSLVAWVRVPNVSSTSETAIFINFGYDGASTPTDEFIQGTFDTGYRGVWHLSGIENSTAFPLVTTEGAPGATNNVNGKIGNGRSFTGVNNGNSFIQVANHPSFDADIQTTLTVEAWGRLFQPAPDDSPFIVLSPCINCERYMLGVDGGSTPIEVNRRVTTTGTGCAGPVCNQGHFRYDNSTTLNDAWNHFVLVYDAASGGQMRTYVNGQLVFTNNEPNGNIKNSNDGDGNTLRDLWFGRRNDNRRFKGIMDELRISNVVRSAAWIETQYNNQNNPESFYTVGALSFPEPAGFASAFDEFIDEGENTELTLEGYNGSIQWQISTNSDTWADIVSATNETYITPVINENTFYRAKITNGGCESYSNTLNIEIRESYFTDGPVGYTYRKKITIDHTKVSGGSNLTNFPLLFSNIDPDLRYKDEGGKVQNINGYDIVFTNRSGVRLDHYLEHYEDETGELIAWVKIPTLNASINTVIYMYYGACGYAGGNQSLTSTFSNGYTGVYHLNNTPSGVDAIIDSSPADNDGNANNMAAGNLVNGFIGRGLTFDGTNDFLSFPAPNNPQVTGNNPRTVQLWARTNGFNSGGLFQGGPNNNDFAIRTTGTNNNFVIRYNAVDTEFTLGGALNNWRLFTLVHEGGTNPVRIYYDGELFDVVGGVALNTTAAEFRIGRRQNIYFNGLIDEVRVSDVARSADWIKTEYNNQWEPQNFYEVGSQSAEFAWLGNVSSDWGNAANWGACGIPDAFADINLPAGRPHYPLLDVDRSVGFLRVNAGATLSLDDKNLTLAQNMRIDGTFSPGTGTLTFNGTSRQRISGSADITFNNLVIDNPVEVYLSTDITIDGDLNFTEGFLQLNGQDISLGQNAAIFNADLNKFVVMNGDGRFCWDNIGNRQFPLGLTKNTYTPVSINNVGDAKRFCVSLCDGVTEEGNCSSTSANDLAVTRTWFIEPDNAENINASITLSWFPAVHGANFDLANAFVSHYDSRGWWEKITGITDISADTPPYSLTANGVSRFSPFGVGSEGSILPVTLISFSAATVKEGVLTKWETASEFNNDFFEVERSVDGVNFEFLGRISGNGTTNIPQSYKYIDRNPISGLSYYRLKQYDIDGVSETFQMVAVQVLDAKNPELRINPNPTYDVMEINFSGFERAHIFEVLVINLNGQIVRQVEKQRIENKRMQLEINDLPQGLYIVKCISTLGIHTQSVMKRN